MVKKRPQLNRNELHQLRWLLGGGLTLLSTWSFFYVDLQMAPFLILASLAVPTALIWPRLPARVPSWIHKTAFPAMVGLFLCDLYLGAEPFPAMVRLDLLILLYRTINYRKRRDDLQLIVLALFPVVVAGVLTVSVLFAFQIVAFTACALALLLVITLAEAEPGQESQNLYRGKTPPEWANLRWGALFRRMREAADWRLFALGAALFGGVVTLSSLLFLALPRFQMDNSFFLERFFNRNTSTGFSDRLEFDDVTNIQQDKSVAMRVEISSDMKLPPELYWRMVVLDEYRDHAFRMSRELRSTAFDRPVTTSDLRNPDPAARAVAGTWTFYVEAGVGRFLPLTGSFRRLLFTEQESFVISERLWLIQLEREPSTMRAFRVDGMSTGAAIADPWYDALGRDLLRRGNRRIQEPDMLTMDLGADDFAKLRARVAEITGGAKLTPAAFARAASTWLTRRHHYSLHMKLPKGDGDPLVRWIESKEPGHCELFAGAFTLLARTAGYPTRVVAGFHGGAWNEDYLIVRNSDAHAWCEYFDGAGHWVRVDPTAAAVSDDPVEASLPEMTGAVLREAAKGWDARLDRLRILWYRRIVNFEQRDQLSLVRAFKQATESSGRQLRFVVEQSLREFKAWLTRPWNTARMAQWGGLTLFVVALAWMTKRFGGRWRWRRWKRAGTGDRVRREAGMWLRRLSASDAGVVEKASVHADLERLRYGPRETWPDPAKVFNAAKKFRAQAAKR